MKMSIEFETNSGIKIQQNDLRNYSRSYVVMFILKYFKSIVKTDKQAEKLIISISIFIFLVSLFVLFNVKKIVNPETEITYEVYQEDLSPEFKKTLSPEILKDIPYKYEKK